MARSYNTTLKAQAAMQSAAYCMSARIVFPACSASFATVTTYRHHHTPLQVKNGCYSVLRKWEFSVFDDIDMMMTLRSRARKGKSIANLILD
jgi:hypothetical protein